MEMELFIGMAKCFSVDLSSLENIVGMGLSITFTLKQGLLTTSALTSPSHTGIGLKASSKTGA